MSFLRVFLHDGAKEKLRLSLIRRASNVGVVRIVKAPVATENVAIQQRDTGIQTPLLNRSNTLSQAGDRVSVDVRASDLFRQFKLNSEKSNLISVLEGLAGMKLDGAVLSKFPGFIEVVQSLNEKMLSCKLSSEEFTTIVDLLWRLGVRNNADFGDISSGFSTQLVALIDELPKTQLVKIISRLEIDLRVPLDSYTYWCLNKELNRWASDGSITDHEYIRNVLGPLQVLAQKELKNAFKPVFTNKKIENRIVSLIEGAHLNGVQIIELILKLKDAGYPQMIQSGIQAVLTIHQEKLLVNLGDTAVLVSALPRDASMRNKDVQSRLIQILLGHYKSDKELTSERIRMLLKCTGELVIDGQDVDEVEVIRLAVPLIADNALILSKMDPDTLTNLHYVSAMAAVTEKEPFLSLCSRTESVIVGKLPKVSPSELAKLSLSFASGILSHPNSFRALGATIRDKAALFAPADFVDAVYGLAYKGLISKGILVEGNIDSVALKIPASALPRLAWAMAVAGHSVVPVWDTVIQRIEKEILINPDMLEKLSKADECMLYESLVAVKVNRVVPLSKSTDRRIGQFQMTWKRPESELDYAKMIQAAGLEVRTDFQPRQLEFALTTVPIYLPEYRLVIDASRNSMVEDSNGRIHHRSVYKRA
ncbi:hypothetical protein C9890_0124 [Perkinsus sp. BL_2016]|nr:hypothetical protein C9890_0124 [Perkinsus sp. BL_2016]